jgi:hypothetical protein
MLCQPDRPLIKNFYQLPADIPTMPRAQLLIARFLIAGAYEKKEGSIRAWFYHINNQTVNLLQGCKLSGRDFVRALTR